MTNTENSPSSDVSPSALSVGLGLLEVFSGDLSFILGFGYFRQIEQK